MPLRHYDRSRGPSRLAEMGALLASAALVCTTGGAVGPLAGQDVPVRPGAPDTSPFRPLELPAPNAYRTASGTPGPLYWQQRADYSIRASLDTVTHTVRGEETIRYSNNSPDTLRYVWIQLDQNLGSAANPLTIVSQRYSDEPGFVGGYVIERVGALSSSSRGARATVTPLAHRISATLMQVTLDRPLLPRGVLHLHIAWRFQVPLYWRTGRERFPEGWLYQVGQWFPRLAVYDDVRGWNTEQYTGHSEFYLEYGDIDYAITAPAGYTVIGSGVLVNAAEVLTAEQRRRLAVAIRSDTTVRIITPEEVGSPALRPSGTGATRTWQFRATNVRDVAWAAAPNFIWDATGWQGILIQALYPSAALPLWARAAEVAREAIRAFSARVAPYPYPTAIHVNGPVGGMEYPMIVFSRAREANQGLNHPERTLLYYSLHEFGHQWFPMLVGSNERLYGWQDEGIVNLVELVVRRDRFREDSLLDDPFVGDKLVADLQTWGSREGTIMSPMERDPDGLFYVHYTKSSGGLYFLRNEVVDSVAFDEALREYARRWAFKHPTPADFFRTMNDALGEDLSWFWRSWFFRTDHLDLAVDSVVQQDTSGVTTSTIHLSLRAEMVAPVDLLIVGADGSKRSVKLPVQVWHRGTPYVYRLVTSPQARPVRIEIDPRGVYPDVKRSNNSWKAAP
ncbi:MAG TPA: M1 family metallopeptidase [Gemmatimonadaceae bacterium]|nr:M1 family metallopeptidase [Gemmatimonadaceae bacterium]